MNCAKPTPPVSPPLSGDTVTLESYVDDRHGFLRLEAGPDAIAGKSGKTVAAWAKFAAGEGHPSGASLNLAGKVFRQFDGAGLVTNDRYDFKGNLSSSTRRFATTYDTSADWSTADVVPDPSVLPPGFEALLETESFPKSFAHDAFNRVVGLGTPDNPATVRPAKAGESGRSASGSSLGMSG